MTVIFGSTKKGNFTTAAGIVVVDRKEQLTPITHWHDRMELAAVAEASQARSPEQRQASWSDREAREFLARTLAEHGKARLAAHRGEGNEAPIALPVEMRGDAQ